MDIDSFKKQRIEGRAILFQRVIEEFKKLNPFAIHQFGSGAIKYKDEFSDIDIWITFKDRDTEKIIKKLPKVFPNIAPVLLIHHSKSWSPAGGYSCSVIHQTDYGLFVVDYYISKLSNTFIKNGSKIIFGENSIKKGEWILNKDIEKSIHDSHSLKKDINLIADLIFISIKLIVRKIQSEDFLNTLKVVHRNFRKMYPGKVKRRVIELNFKSNYKLLNDLYSVASKTQKRSVSKIRKFSKLVEKLYFEAT